MKVDYKFESTKLIVTIDGDKDDTPVLSLIIDLAEIPSEVLALIAKK